MDVLCKCGHTQSIHFPKLKHYKCAGYFNDGLEMLDCECKEFDQDNLSYVEQLAKQRNLI